MDDTYVVIGNDLGTNICINAMVEIVSIDHEHGYPTRFINTNLECFLKCIVVFLEYEDGLVEADEDEVCNVIQEMKNELDKIDMQALRSSENWWSIILEQVEMGMM